MIILGCDPGLTGALSLIRPGEGLLAVADLPACPNGLETGKMMRWLDCAGVATVLADWSAKFDFARESVHSAIERPIATPNIRGRAFNTPTQTIAAQFDTFGALRAILMRLGPVEAVNPGEWKKLYGFGKDKAAARAICLSLYPAAPVTRVKDHNRAESILIGHWHLRKIHG